MTVNFRNSAGTDLDNLFYIANNNAGAIGFRESGGQDLGNRYNSGSLGYNVGYKNSAGTDMGYLRGNSPPYTHILTVARTNSWFKKYGYNRSANNTGSISPNTVDGYTIDHLTVGGKNTNNKNLQMGLYNLKTTKTFQVSIDNLYTVTVTLDTTNVDTNNRNGEVQVPLEIADYMKSKENANVYLTIKSV